MITLALKLLWTNPVDLNDPYGERVSTHSLPIGMLLGSTAVLKQSEIATAQAVIATNKAVLTAADAVATAADRVQTAADRVQTGLDTAQVGLDKTATAADRVQTGLDVASTAMSVTLTDANVLATEVAKDAALTVGSIYATTALGIAATTDGEYFWIPSSESYASLSLYKNNVGVAFDTDKKITDSSRISFSGVRYRSCPPANINSAAWEILDSTGKRGVAMMADGSWLVSKLQMMGVGSGYRTSGYIFDIADDAGNRVFGIDNKGSIFLKLTQKALTLLSNQLSIYTPTLWRGSVAAEDIIATDKLITAKIDDTATSPSWYGEIRQPRDSTTLAAIASGTQRLQLYLYIGQSNSLASGVDDSILVEQRFPYHVLKYIAGSASDGTGAISVGTLNDVVAAQDFQYPYPQNSAAFSTQYRSRLIGETPNPILVRADGKGGAPLSDFAKTASPSYCYDNAMTTVDASFDIAKSYGMDLDVNIVFVQGENSGSGGTGTSVATYQGWLSTLLNNYITDVKANIARVPKIIIWQTNGLTTGANDQRNGALAHLAETILRRGTSCVLAAPMYQCPISDTIHGTSIARMMQGEITDLVIREIKANGTWIPLDLDRNPDGTAKVSRVGTTITGKFNRPVMVDDDWVPTVGANLGFQYTGTTISSVSIVDGSADFTITLASSVGGILSYASRDCDAGYLHTGGASGTNWSAARGMIYSNSNIESVWYQLGYTLPRFIRHYLVRFEETIA